ncbi:MAG: hypothetical protein J2O46_03605 [Nocardioides sp.]|nr:hypothetical protein [Nocardioides sp.]
MSNKVRKTLTLDPDVVEAFGDDSAALSATVNEILRDELGRRARRAALGAYLDEMDQRYGAVDAETIAEFRAAFSS